jgi:hypothetical protein
MTAAQAARPEILRQLPAIAKHYARFCVTMQRTGGKPEVCDDIGQVGRGQKSIFVTILAYPHKIRRRFIAELIIPSIRIF